MSGSRVMATAIQRAVLVLERRVSSLMVVNLKLGCENGSLIRVARRFGVGSMGGLDSIPAAWSGCLRFLQ